jgi:endonuclease-3
MRTTGTVEIFNSEYAAIMTIFYRRNRRRIVSNHKPAKPEHKEKKRLAEIMAILEPRYPDKRPLLNYRNPFELLTATVLAAQCTDAEVNLVTAELFRRYPDPAALASSPLEELEKIVHSTGFFRAKARNIRALARLLLERHGGDTPASMEELTALPGVGRKTASVVLSSCFGVPAIIVDTHFSRVCRRLGFTVSDRPERIERDMASLAPESEWTAVSQVLNRFGRDTCRARKPACALCAGGKPLYAAGQRGACPVEARCPWPKSLLSLT